MSALTLKISEMKVILFDTNDTFETLLPLCYTRPVSGFRVGILTIKEKWERFLPGEYSALTAEYLREKFPVGISQDEEALFVAGNVLPNKRLADVVAALSAGSCLVDGDGIVAYRGNMHGFEAIQAENSGKKVGEDENNVKLFGHSTADTSVGNIRRIRYVFDVFRYNGEEIVRDYVLLVKGKNKQKLDPSVTLIGPKNLTGGLPSVYVEEGASVEGAILNVKNGPIYIGKDAIVMEGACLRGPVALCEHSLVRMGTKIYGETTVGPFCKVGGELDNVVMFGYSNKAHDGYLGNAVIGHWCNLGAGATASNLKNDYSKIRIWNYHTRTFMRTDLQFCGLIMGDHSKAGINTMFNTATVVGVGVNLHGSGFPRTFIPSFSTGSPEGGFDNVVIDKFMETAGKVMARRNKTLTDADRHIFETIYRSASRFK